MYLRILVNSQLRDFQHLLWRFRPEEPLQVHPLNTVTFGVNASHYLRIRTLRELAHIYAGQKPTNGSPSKKRLQQSAWDTRLKNKIETQMTISTPQEKFRNFFCKDYMYTQIDYEDTARLIKEDYTTNSSTPARNHFGEKYSLAQEIKEV